MTSKLYNTSTTNSMSHLYNTGNQYIKTINSKMLHVANVQLYLVLSQRRKRTICSMLLNV